MATNAIRSEVEAVTVYSRGARVIRRAVLARNGGYPASVTLTGLPLTLHDDSVKVALLASGEGRAPTARDIRVVLDVPERDDGLMPVTPAELDAARLEEERIAARLSQLRRELERVRGLALLERPPGAEGEPPVASPTDARLSLIEFRESESRALAADVETEERAHEQARRHRRDLEARNRRATTARRADEHELRKAVVVSLSGHDGDAAEVAIELEYQVPGARWAPAYALHLDREMTRATLSMRAVVAQRSGEDWSGVALTLSTAEMQRFTELPELASMRIGRRQAPPPKAGWRPPPSGTDELYADWDRAFRAELYDRAPPQPRGRPKPVLPPEPEPVAEYAALAEEDEYAEDTAVFGAPPAAGAAPVASAAAPELDAFAPMRTMAPGPPQGVAPAARKSGGLLGGLFGGSGGAPPAPPQLERARAKKMAAPAAPGAPAPMQQHQQFAPPPPVEEVVGDDLLAYGDLRMPSPTDRRRGKLVLATRQEIYLQLLVAQEVTLSIDPIAAIGHATGLADAIDDDRLPRGCRLAWSEHFDYAYPTRARVDVPSDGSFHAVPLAEGDAAVRRRYVVVPRESADVFRTAAFDNPLDAPLLAGPIDVYLGGDFLLTSRVDTTPARGAVDLGLGVEQGIKVARNIRYREDTAGLMGGSLELHHQIVVDINNNLAQSAPVEVRERVPYVREDDEDEIKLNVRSVTPAWERYQPEAEHPGEPELHGGYRWRIDVAAGGSETVRAEYEIKISSKHELVGGNRREA